MNLLDKFRMNQSAAPASARGPQLDHAIVIGGSIAGLLTARVLTNHAARVTIIERDRLPGAPAFRKGAPHARHPHGLLARGLQIMEELFPGLTEELHAGGARPVNAGSGIRLVIGDAPVQPFVTPLSVTACSRPLLEYTIASRLRRMPQIHWLDRCSVTELMTDSAGGRVTGVHLQHLDQGPAAAQPLRADLVVDASGRGSKMPKWLNDLGYAAPEETVIDAKTGYTTQIIKVPAELAAELGWTVFYSMPKAPDRSRGGIVVPLEGDRWQVTLIGFNGDYPPIEAAAFRAFARTLPTPDIDAILAQAEPVTAPYAFRNVANRLRKYEGLPRYPDGVAVIGDAVYAFNPVYGQGMTVAALGALALDDCLARQASANALDPTAGLMARFQPQLAKVIAGPWQMATGQDLRWPAVGQTRQVDPVTRLVQRYFDRVLDAMTTDGEVAAAFVQVQNMLQPPTTLFHPKVARRVLLSHTQGVSPQPVDVKLSRAALREIAS